MWNMKKIMILGGAENQLPLILSAKKLGYYIVLCDYAEENKGRKYSDAFYCVSTLDEQAVLHVAKTESVDGIITNSEPAVPVSAYVANRLGLPSNPYNSMLILSRKDLFREFLRDNGFNCPLSFVVSELEDAKDIVSNLQLPMMIKPADSSGSRGVCLIESKNEITKAFSDAMSFSKVKAVILEEYIESANEFLIGGDIFVNNGKVMFWGLLNCIRDKSRNEFIPLGKSSPVKITKQQFEIIKQTLQMIVDILDIKFGAFNVELIFGKSDQLFVIEMNPRNGGNRIPEFLKLLTGVDLFEATVKAGVGVQELNFEVSNIPKYMSTYILHSFTDGILTDVIFDDKIKQNIVELKLYRNIGERVNRFENAADLIGIVFLEFYSEQEMNLRLKHIDEHIKIKVG
jgi:biotin carboxylase